MSIQQPPFQFNLGDWARIKGSTHTGQVRARRDGIGFPNEYLLACQDVPGTPHQSWWCEDQLAPSKKPLSPHEQRELSRQRLAAQQTLQHAPASESAN
ncbi:MAG: hypothetical protein KBF33_01610 [Comamonas sp.]|nr:hypothetical protein [Comamonas sp.]